MNERLIVFVSYIYICVYINNRYYKMFERRVVLERRNFGSLLQYTFIRSKLLPRNNNAVLIVHTFNLVNITFKLFTKSTETSKTHSRELNMIKRKNSSLQRIKSLNEIKSRRACAYANKAKRRFNNDVRTGFNSKCG